MTKTSIEIDNLLYLGKRKVDLPNNLELFSLSISYLISDFSEINNISVETIMECIREHNEIVKLYKC